MSAPYGYCLCGCGEKTWVATRSDSSRGYTKGEPVRYRSGHYRRPGARWLEEDRGHETPCWVWQRHIDPESGYGRTRGPKSRSSIGAHRVIYEQMVGAIPVGLELDHLCRVRACVNPDHLEPVTRSENVRRGAATKLVPESVREIRKARGAASATLLARRYSVSSAHIYAIWRGESWA